MGKIGMTEILIILAIIVVLFGAKRIPELFKNLGSGIKAFKSEMNNKEGDSPADK